MRKIYLFLFTLLGVLLVSAQDKFVVTYTFDDTYVATVNEGSEALIARDATTGGDRILSSKFVTENNSSAWEGEIRTNVTTFKTTYIRMDIVPKESYRLVIDSIVPRQKMNNTGGAFNFRVGCTLSGITPVENVSASDVQGFKTDYSEYIYKPAVENATTQGMDFVSAWLTARCLNNASSLWSIDEVRVYGTYEKVDENATVIKVSNDQKQIIRLGVDLGALWYFQSYIKDRLAQLAVGDMKAEFVRIGFANAYQAEKNVFNEAGYKAELEAMEAMRKANPEILYFGSPSALHTVYSNEDKVKLFGHIDNVPWSPFPLWVQEWNNTGTTKVMEDGTVVPVFEKGDFHIDELLKCFADHLNFLHKKGYKFTYMDLSNEQTIITPAIAKYVHDNLPSKLDVGVHMPKIIAPSTWSVQGGIDWLNEVDTSKGEHLSFDVAAIHNTGTGGSLDEFGAMSIAMGKEAWNTEMHEWIGIELHDEIINSDVLWQHMRAGFSGIDTWLFFGSSGGRAHSMINSHWKNGIITKTGKYEIFKKLVNNANGGNYVDVSKPYESVQTSAFIKDNVLLVWTLNKNERAISDVLYQFDEWAIDNKEIEVTRWHKDLPIEGKITSFSNSSSKEFTYDLEGESLYAFKINLGQEGALNSSVLEDDNFVVYQDIGSPQIVIESRDQNEFEAPASYSVIDINGKTIEEGKLLDSTFRTRELASGVYLVSIDTGVGVVNKKALVK